jgi:parvulin-like peptidyl-prolyl isomerase
MNWRGIKLALPRAWMWRKLVLVGCAATVAVAAFCWGRYGTMSRAGAQAPVANNGSVVGIHQGDYGRRVVAYLYDSIPITREDLGEYLIARFGAERVEFLVNRRIVEMACKAKGIYVTDTEVQEQLKKDLESFGTHVTVADFTNQILKRFNKSLYEWKEDVIRPKLALSKLVRQQIVVTEEDLKKAFEARHGPKVQCRMIVVPKDNREKDTIWKEVSDGNAEKFKEYAAKSHIPQIASQHGLIPPITKHLGDPNIEKAAFALQKGEVSALIQLKEDGSWVILRCEEHLPADNTKRYEDERWKLHKDVFEYKLAMEIPKVFQKLREEARPKVVMERPLRQEDLERDARRELMPPSSAPPAGQNLPPVTNVPSTVRPQAN